MTKEKQIEEMAKDVLNSSILSIEDASNVAKSLYRRGYRKASDVIDEIVDFLFGLEKIERLYAGEREALGIRYAIKKIKEKYESEKDNG